MPTRYIGAPLGASSGISKAEHNAHHAAIAEDLAIAYLNQGVYDAATAYVTNDVVTHGGADWVALQNSTGQTPAAGAYWKAFGGGGSEGAYINRGAYDAATTYQAHNIVTHSGRHWASLQNSNLGNTPTESAYWTGFITGSDFTESVEDVVAAFFVAGAGITFTHDDALNTFTIVNSAPLTTEQVQDIVGAMVAAGTNANAVYDDATGTLTISATGDGTGLTQEQIEDIVAALLVQGANVTLSYNDGTGQLSIAAAGGGSSPAPSNLGTTSTFTPALATSDYFYGTTNANSTLANPTGTPVNGQALIIEITKGGGTHTLTLGTNYEASDKMDLAEFTAAPSGALVTLFFLYSPSKSKFVGHGLTVD